MNNNLPNKSKYSPIFWGTLFVSFGSGILLERYDLLNTQIFSFLNLLSILLILIGTSFLKIPTVLKQIVIGLIAISISVSILNLLSSFKTHFRYWDDTRNTTNNSYKQVEYDSIRDSANIIIKGGALDLDISSISTMAIKFQSNDIRNFNLNCDSSFSNYELNFNSKYFHSAKNGIVGDLQLSDSAIWTINATLGASQVKGDFKNIKVGKLLISAGVSELNFEFGKKHNDTEILIEAGASDIELNIPYDAYCELSTNTALSDYNFQDFNEEYSGFYRTPETQNSEHRFIITISGGISDLKINRYK